LVRFLAFWIQAQTRLGRVEIEAGNFFIAPLVEVPPLTPRANKSASS